MHWELLGFKENPFNIEPIVKDTLALYSGRHEEIKWCSKVLTQKNALMVIEGARGIGTTSFANYLRFSAQEKQDYMTPRNEIRVEPNWNLETLLTVIVSNIVREIEFFQPEKISKDKRFQEAKGLTMRIAEAYRSFGVEAFGFGVSYGKSAGIVSQPMIVSSSILGHHLEDLSALALESDYRYGLLIQLNNLNVDIIHDKNYLRYLFNTLRDYLQTRGMSWLLVGDCGLRQFITHQAARLDEIISDEINLSPLKKLEYEQLIRTRFEFFRFNEKIKSPIEPAVFSYLYELTGGRLRNIFGLLQRLMRQLYVGDLTDRLTLDAAQPMLMKLMACDRIVRAYLSSEEELAAIKEVWQARDISSLYNYAHSPY